MNNSVRKERSFCCLAVCGVLICTVANGAEEKKPDSVALLRQSEEATRVLPYFGQSVYQRRMQEGEWKAEVVVHHASSTLMRVEMNSPEQAKGTVILRTREAVWVTPTDKEKREKVRKETEFIPWYRLFRSGQGVDFEDINLLKNNYDISYVGEETIAEHPALHIVVSSPKKDRPSIQLWVDKESKFQLKYERYTCEGLLLESCTFSRIQINAPMSYELFLTDHLERLFALHDDEIDKEPIPLDFTPYPTTWLPRGFEKRTENRWKGDSGVTLHSSYSDGLAHLSIYQRRQTKEELEKSRKEPNSSTPVINRMKIDQRGRVIYFREENGIRISAVGDLPASDIIQTLTKLKSSSPPKPASTAVSPSGPQ